jgi:hypothetical protein
MDSDQVVVVKRRNRTEKRRGIVRWSLADFRGAATVVERRKQDRQSICLTGGFSSLSNQRHSYNGDVQDQKSSRPGSILYSIREEESSTHHSVSKQERIRQIRVVSKAGIAMAPHLALSSS